MATHVWEHETDTAPYNGMHPLSATALDVTAIVIGRIIFGGFFLFSSLNHFVDRGALVSATLPSGNPPHPGPLHLHRNVPSVANANRLSLAVK